MGISPEKKVVREPSPIMEVDNKISELTPLTIKNSIKVKGRNVNNASPLVRTCNKVESRNFKNEIDNMEQPFLKT